MSRSYKNVRPKKHFVYTVDDLMTLYGVVRNTVSNWVKEGLKPSDGFTPYVFHGTEVKRFRDARRPTNKTHLRKGEFKCLVCGYRMFPAPESLSCRAAKNGLFGLWGTCSNCGRVVTKIVNETDCDKILKCADTNTSLASLDDGYEVIPAGIGNDRQSETEIWYVENDRILYAWLQFAGRWDDKTISAKLAAIRQFEDFCDGKAFAKVTISDVVAFREHLKSSVDAPAKEQISISTVRHRASHLKSFFEWLVEQKGYGGLNKTLPRYFELPKKFDAVALAPNERIVPTLEEAVEMVSGMPCRTIKERRDRAMVSIAFLAALRADTITSLKIKHLEMSAKIVVQDAKSSRTKNGKSLRINFFPLPAIFAKVVCDWKKELLALGFEEEDALFPDEKHLVKRQLASSTDNIPAMSSTHAVSAAFKTASEPLRTQFSPHSAKHCIGNLIMKICKSPEALKAWSMNMGHESEDVTARYYKRIPDDRVFEIFDQFDVENVETVDDKDIMLLYHEYRLDTGTPEFERARKLVLERQAKANGADEV
jgi:integrase